MSDATNRPTILRSFLRSDLLKLAALPLLLAIVLVWPAIIGQGVLAPTDIVANDSFISGQIPGSTPPVANPMISDATDQFIPWRFYAREQLAQGRFPLWNPYNLLGTHFFASLQPQIFGPFNLIWLLLPPVWGLAAIAALKLAVAGMGMGFLLRRLGLSIGPALLGAVALELAGPQVVWLQLSIGDALPLIPWMLWAALGWISSLDLRWLAATALLVCWQFLTGHAETALNACGLLLLFSLAAWFASKWRGKESLLVFGGLAVAAILGTLMAAVQLLPFLEILPASYQWVWRAQEHAQYNALPGSAWFLWLSPNWFGSVANYSGPFNYVEANPYVGALTLLLAPLGLVLTPLRLYRAHLKGAALPSLTFRALLSPRAPLFWLIVALCTLSLAYSIPPLNLLRELPGINTTYQQRFIAVAGFCIIVLAALGAERLLELTGKVRGLLPRIIAAALGFCCILFLLPGMSVWTVDPRQLADYMSAWHAWAGAIFCASLLLLLAVLIGLLRPPSATFLLLGLLTLDMMRAAWGFNGTMPSETFYPTNPIISYLQQRGPTERFAMNGPFALADTLMFYKIGDYRSYEPTQDNRQVEYARMMSSPYPSGEFNAIYLVLAKPKAPQLAAIGIRWLITEAADDPNSWQPAPERGAIYEMVVKYKNFVLWRNRFARPYVSFASQFRVAPDGVTALEAVTNRTLGDSTAIVEERGTHFPSDVASEEGGAAIRSDENTTLASYQPGEIMLRVAAAQTRLVVVNESWSSGWRAEIDGQTAPVFTTNYIAQGVVVPAGEHSVRLVYDPVSFRWGRLISSAAWALWLGILATLIRRTFIRGRTIPAAAPSSR